MKILSDEKLSAKTKNVNVSYWLRSGYTCDPFFVVERISVLNVCLIVVLMAVKMELMTLGGVLVLIFYKRYSAIPSLD